MTVIDRANHHLFAPLLYQMATGILAEGDIVPPIRDVLRRQRNASGMLGEVDRSTLMAAASPSTRSVGAARSRMTA